MIHAERKRELLHRLAVTAAAVADHEKSAENPNQQDEIDFYSKVAIKAMGLEEVVVQIRKRNLEIGR